LDQARNIGGNNKAFQIYQYDFRVSDTERVYDITFKYIYKYVTVPESSNSETYTVHDNTKNLKALYVE